MRNVRNIFGLLCVFLLFTYGCKKDEYSASTKLEYHVMKRSDHNINIIYSYQIAVSEGDTSLKTSLILIDSTLNQTINFGELIFNSKNIRNEDSLSLMLTQNYISITNLYDKKTLSEYSDNIEEMVAEVFDSLKAKTRTIAFQALCVYNSLAKAVNRDTVLGDIKFSVFGGYTNGTNSFFCEQDYLVDIPSFKSYLTDLKITQPDNEGIGYFLGALSGVSNGELTLAEIRGKLEIYFTDSASSMMWPQGGQCGCCANYSGPCLYWNIACLEHDYLCQSCGSWWCGWGCQPTSCEGNTIAWYWFI